MKMKPMKGWENLYTINENAEIYSVPRNGTRKTPHKMSQSTDSYGYKVVKLRNKNKVVTCKVHRLVALTFIPNPENKPQVNHKDGNKLNNNVDNLEWVTASENIKHAKSLGLQQECYNRVKVNQIKDGKIIATYPSLKQAEIETGIGWTGISAVIRGLRKSAGGYYWERCNDYPERE